MAIRWDRLGRFALLVLFTGVLLMYVGPVRAWVVTYREAAHHRQIVAELKTENRRLRERRADLRRPAVLEREARRLGMVKQGERGYVIEGLPAR